MPTPVSSTAGEEWLLLIIVTLAGGAGLGTVQWRGHGHPGVGVLIPALAACFAAGSFWLTVAVTAAVDGSVAAHRSRLRARDPFTHLVSDMVDLLALLEYEPALVDPTVRREALGLLERIARGQERVIAEPLGRQRRRSMVQEPTGRAFRHHVAGIAAATRDLKRSVLSPGRDTWPALRTRLHDMLTATVHARWDLLLHREPDPAAKALLVRLLSLGRSLLVLLVPPALLIALQAFHVIPENPPTGVQVIAYVAWPAIVLLLWLDPALAQKVDLVKSAKDLIPRGSSEK